MHRLIKQISTIACIGLLSLLISACGNSTGGANDANVAATVNGMSITLAEVDNVLNQQLQGKQAQLSPLELAQARLQIVQTLIQKEVLLQRAKQENLLPTDDEIGQEVNRQMQQSGLTQEKFNEQLKASGLTPESFREEARKALAIKKLQDKTNSKVQPPSDKEVEDYFLGNKEQFVNQRGVSLAEISTNPQDVGLQDDAKSDAEAKAKIDVIYQQLKNGADFATVARARSEDQYNAHGGDVGFLTDEQLKTNFPEDLVANLYGKDTGSFTDPILVKGTWYIFKVQGKQLQSENLTLESQGVRQQIADGIVNQRKQLLNTALLDVVMNEARVVNNLTVKMLDNPNTFGVVRPAGAPGASPAATAAPASTAAPAAGPIKPDTKGSPAAKPIK